MAVEFEEKRHVDATSTFSFRLVFSLCAVAEIHSGLLKMWDGHTPRSPIETEGSLLTMAFSGAIMCNMQYVQTYIHPLFLSLYQIAVYRVPIRWSSCSPLRHSLNEAPDDHPQNKR